MRTAVSSQTFRNVNLESTDAGKAGWFWRSDKLGKGYTYKNPKVQPLTAEEAYLQTIVLGNNGRPLNKLTIAENALDAVKGVAFSRPRERLQATAKPKLILYAHGGLNNEEDSIRRIRVMAPYFSQNGIYPLFITWKTGVLESITGMLKDNMAKIFNVSAQAAEGGLLSDIADRLSEARDRTIEVASEHLLVKAVWSEMKQNAGASIRREGGVKALAKHLTKLNTQLPGLEIHLAGHSAGAILLGHFLKTLDRNISIASLSLFAPACTVAFANATLLPAVKRRCLKKEDMHFDILDDVMERDDSVGPYGKSLLYLVSRALEEVHKMPLLGMARAWQTTPPQDQWNDSASIKRALKDWQQFAGGKITPVLHDRNKANVSTGVKTIKLAHGSFDNDIAVISKLIQRVRGKKLAASVENLSWF